MCKVMIISGIKNSENAKKFMLRSEHAMTEVDKDGLGYVAMKGDGEFFSEKWLNKSEAFVNDKEYDSNSEEEYKALSSLNKILAVPPRIQKYGLTGTKDWTDVKSILFHSRFATCDKSFCNTHPFIHKSTALIHNGVIRNEFAFDKKLSTCDSEVILQQYLERDVTNFPNRIRRVTADLEGYWACGIFSKDVKGIPILDIFKENTSKLCAAFIEEIGGVVFCTDKDIILSTLKGLFWKQDVQIVYVKPHVMVRLNAITGDIIGFYKCTNKDTQIKMVHKGYFDKKHGKWINHETNLTEYERQSDATNMEVDVIADLWAFFDTLPVAKQKELNAIQYIDDRLLAIEKLFKGGDALNNTAS